MFSPTELQKLVIISGHYGCGKTNLAINFALDLAQTGEKVTLVDLDVVNPYFRSSDYTDMLTEAKVEVIAPTFAGTTLDAPSLSGSVAAAFGRDGYLVIDAGGDDVGATALGRYRREVGAMEHDFLYVVNANRNLTHSAEDAISILREIEKACGHSATGVVNNTHLQAETTCATVSRGEQFGVQCAQIAEVPLVCVCVPAEFSDEQRDILDTSEEKIYSVRRLVLPPW